MSPIASLFITLLVLHVVEGLLWVRRSALAFARGWRRYRRVSTEGPFGDKTHGFLLLWPLPPLYELFVVEPWPLLYAQDQVWNLSLETGLGAEAPREPEPRPPESVQRARAEGKEVYARGLLAGTSSAALAHALAATLRAWSEAKPKKRAELAAQALRARFDRRAVRERLELFRTQTRGLHLLGNLFPFTLFGALYAFFFVHALSVRWPALLALVLTPLVLIWIETYRAHRRLYPELRGDRAMKMLMLILSFPAAARARAWLGRDVLALYHPLAVASVLLPREALLAFAGEQWRCLRFPLQPEPEGARAALEAGRAELRAACAQLLAEVEIDPLSLEAPPARTTATAGAYCPRCHAEFTEAEGSCPDCPGVARRAFP